MHCEHFEADRCRSCAWIRRDYAEQLQAKQSRTEAWLQSFAAQGRAVEWLPAQASPLEGMRNKAKMAVGGSIESPSLGLYGLGQLPVDLSDCQLYGPELSALFPLIKEFIALAELQPYALDTRRGELKFVLLTRPWPDSPVQLRLVLRSREALDRVAKHQPWLQARLPAASVISVNLQPEHKAVLEGPEEILLSPDRWLPVSFNQHDLLFGTRSFLQTNSVVAQALYAQAAAWIDALDPAEILDLYCGVGPFAYHAAAAQRCVFAVESSDEAIAAATAALPRNANPSIEFRVGDARQALDKRYDLVIVNPPRAGLGTELCAELRRSQTPSLLYSSCNLDSLHRDLQRIGNFRLHCARVFDMFPHSEHFEILALLHKG